MIKEKLLKLCLAPLRLLPIKENRIVFICNRGGGFCCNPKYMAQYIHENYGSQYEIIFFYNDESVVKRNNCDWITWKKFDGFGYIEALVTAKYIVSNITIPRFVPYRRQQVKMCTWHGSAFKGTGDMEYNFDKYDVFLAENELTYKVIREIWMYRGEILRTGMPRNDCLFNFTKKQIKNIKEKIGVPEEHLLLYAPTFRDKGDADCFSVDFLKLKAHLEDRFGGSWQVAFRYHPLQKKRNLPSGCIDLSTYEDMQELLMCTDILVTDYSSCMWDFSLMGKPCFVYASDGYTGNCGKESRPVRLGLKPCQCCIQCGCYGKCSGDGYQNAVTQFTGRDEAICVGQALYEKTRPECLLWAEVISIERKRSKTCENITDF